MYQINRVIVDAANLSKPCPTSSIWANIVPFFTPGHCCSRQMKAKTLFFLKKKNTIKPKPEGREGINKRKRIVDARPSGRVRRFRWKGGEIGSLSATREVTRYSRRPRGPKWDELLFILRAVRFGWRKRPRRLGISVRHVHLLWDNLCCVAKSSLEPTDARRWR